MKPTSPPVPTQVSMAFSHMGFFVHDIDRMARFYRDVLGLTETDHGALGTVHLVFLSSDPAEHHQVVLASGRPPNLPFNAINQISFRVPDLSALREMRRRVTLEPDVADLVCISHGNAISIYFRDPEQNRIEIFLDMPWYCQQPMREPIDIDRPDEDVMAEVEALARSRPGFESRASWQARMAERMGRA